MVLILVIYLNQRSRNARRVQAKLQEINDIKSAFFANLSHEFRTPLTLMLGPAEKLLEKATQQDKPMLQLIHRNASRLLALDEQLLEFTRIDSGNQKINLAKGNIVSLVSAVTTAFNLAAEKKNIQYTQQYAEHPIETYFDPDILEKVVSNLISNAIKYTPSKGAVEISTRIASDEYLSTLGDNHASDYILIEVKDNGPGIPYEKQERIFADSINSIIIRVGFMMDMASAWLL